MIIFRQISKDGGIIEVTKSEEVIKDTVVSRIAVLATKFGLPVPEFLDTMRWLINKECAYCEFSTEVLKKLSKLGETQAESYIKQILEAKKDNNEQKLNEIKAEVKAVLDDNHKA